MPIRLNIRDLFNKLESVKEMSLNKFNKEAWFFIFKNIIVDQERRIQKLERHMRKPRIYKCLKCDFDLMFEIERDEDAGGGFLGHPIFKCPKCAENYDGKIHKNGDQYPDYNS